MSSFDGFVLIAVPFILSLLGIAYLSIKLIELISRFRGRRGTDFVFQRFKEESHKPIESTWGIRVIHPEKRIERCSVTYNGSPLPFWDKEDELYYERFIVKMGGANVRVPKGDENDDAIVVVKDGKKTLRKSTFGDIPRARR